MAKMTDSEIKRMIVDVYNVMHKQATVNYEAGKNDNYLVSHYTVEDYKKIIKFLTGHDPSIR